MNIRDVMDMLGPMNLLNINLAYGSMPEILYAYYGKLKIMIKLRSLLLNA